MRKNVETTEIYGGSQCQAAMGAIFGFGTGVLFVPTPLNIAVGSVSVLIGAIGGYMCN
jgi:uncharacterized membrane protein